MESRLRNNENFCEDKRIRKPLIEKRRRDRINYSLEILKQMLLNCDPELITIKKNGPRPGKLEKADILEMTVDYITQIKEKMKREQLEESLIARRQFESQNQCFVEQNYSSHYENFVNMESEHFANTVKAEHVEHSVRSRMQFADNVSGQNECFMGQSYRTNENFGSKLLQVEVCEADSSCEILCSPGSSLLRESLHYSPAIDLRQNADLEENVKVEDVWRPW